MTTPEYSLQPQTARSLSFGLFLSKKAVGGLRKMSDGFLQRRGAAKDEKETSTCDDLFLDLTVLRRFCLFCFTQLSKRFVNINGKRRFISRLITRQICLTLVDDLLTVIVYYALKEFIFWAFPDPKLLLVLLLDREHFYVMQPMPIPWLGCFPRRQRKILVFRRGRRNI